MMWIYKTQKLNVGERLTLPDGDMLVGSNIEADGKNGFRVIVHILCREEGVPLSQYDPQAAKPEPTQ